MLPKLICPWNALSYSVPKETSTNNPKVVWGSQLGKGWTRPIWLSWVLKIHKNKDIQSVSQILEVISNTLDALIKQILILLNKPPDILYEVAAFTTFLLNIFHFLEVRKWDFFWNRLGFEIFTNLNVLQCLSQSKCFIHKLLFLVVIHY